MEMTTTASAPPLGFPEKLMPIGGSWIASSNAATLTVANPATGEPIAEVPSATVQDGMSAVDAAVDAQPAWAATPARERADILFRTYEGILARRDEFAALITAEMGKPLPEAQTEVDYGAGFFRWFAESAGGYTPKASSASNPEAITRSPSPNAPWDRPC